MRVVEDRAASGAELLPTGQALIDARALVLPSLAGNLGDAPDLATVNAAHFAIGPAHVFNIVEALVFSLELLVNVYELHNARILAKAGFCVKCIIALQILYSGHLRKTGGRGVTNEKRRYQESVDSKQFKIALGLPAEDPASGTGGTVGACPTVRRCGTICAQKV